MSEMNELVYFLLESCKDRTCLKAFYHLTKLLSIPGTEVHTYRYRIELVRKHIGLIDFQWENGKVDFYAVKKPDYRYFAFVDVLSPSKLWEGRGNALYLFAHSGRGILGWTRFTAPPPTIGPRGIILPALRGNGKSKDNLQERRGVCINHFLWSNKSQAWGRFRKARGLKTLYMAVFERGLYPAIKGLWGRMPLGIEATVLYGLSSSVFRNLSPLTVLSGKTSGYSSIHLGEELFKAWRDENKRAILRSELFRKGYYILTNLANLPQVVHRLVYEDKLPEAVALLDKKTILSKLTPAEGGLEDKEYILQYLEAEKKALKLMKEPLIAFEVLLEFHKNFA